MSADVTDLVTRLEVVLDAEEAVYRRLRALLQREEKELVELDPTVLERTTAEKQALAAEAKLHEESRLGLTVRLGALIGSEAARPKISELVERLGSKAGQLPVLHARLHALVEVTQGLLVANERFAARSLSRVQDTLKLLGQSSEETSGYGPGAAGAERTGRGRLVRAAI
jgi:flagellar biosynthesis/type III secretory pathway chaperone